MSETAAPQPAAAGPPEPPRRKGLGPLAWIAIGCGGIAVIALGLLVATGFFIAKKGKQAIEHFEEDPTKALAELAVKLNSELEIVSSDPNARTMTVRNRRTGEVVTLNWDEIREGRLGVRTGEGEFELEVGGEGGDAVLKVTKDGEETLALGGASAAEIPAWLPRFPDTTPRGLFRQRAPGGATGAFSLETEASPREVLDFYGARLEASGFRVTRSDVAGALGSGGQITAEAGSGGRKVTVTAGTAGKVTQVAVYFSDG